MAFWPFRKRTKPQAAPSPTGDRGILVFSHPSEIIQAEKALKEAGWPIRVVGPPPEIQSGFDLVIELPIVEELNILKVLDRFN